MAIEYTDCITHPHFNECPRYDIKPSDSVVLAKKFWGMSIPSFPLLQGPIRPVLIAPDRVIPMAQVEIV